MTRDKRVLRFNRGQRVWHVLLERWFTYDHCDDEFPNESIVFKNFWDNNFDYDVDNRFSVQTEFLRSMDTLYPGK